MNNMPTTRAPQTNKDLINLANTVGDFIRYWGFRRIHGQIWTQVFLSQKPLSGADLTRSLKVSKALVSPALKELLKHKLIVQNKVDQKTKSYSANPNVLEVIRNVLSKRESVLIKKAENNFLALKDSLKESSEINTSRLNDLGSIISVGALASNFILTNLSKEKIEMWKRISEMKSS
jgi:DNA-binding transcriptional regulator GbsR (MarR family)